MVEKHPKTVIFLAEAAGMLIELAAARLLSPYFGSGNAVWTAIIGVILLSNSIGNRIGGKMSGQKGTGAPSLFLLLASLFASAVSYLSDAVCLLVDSNIGNNTAAAFVSAVILLFPVSVCLGTIPPLIMASQTVSYGENGERIGRVYQASTVGGLFGTFVGGYLLIPFVGISCILVVSSFVLLVLSLPLRNCTISIGRRRSPVKSLLSLPVASLAIALWFLLFHSGSSTVFEDTLVFDSEYNRILVQDTYYRGKPARLMLMNSGFQSGTYTEEGERYELLFEVLSRFSAFVEDDDSLLLVGGAAYQFPKWVLANTDASIDTVEIDALVYELAKKYFYLEDCLKEFDKNGERFRNFTEDAKVYLKNCKNTYDAVFMDAFAGDEPVWSLTTVETVRQIESLLTEDGVYVLNIVGGGEGNRAFLEAEVKTLMQVFPFVSVEECSHKEGEKVWNYVVSCSKDPSKVKGDVMLSKESKGFKEFFESLETAMVLTDDYCPIQSLLPKK